MGSSRITSLLGRLGVYKRLKPSFLIIGAQKAGTSALYSMLAQHKCVKTGPIKELHFFDEEDQYANGIEGYWNKFPYAPNHFYTFEATPKYIAHPSCAERIKKHLPNVKLILILRDPVTRAFSAWNMRRDFKNHPKHGHLHDARSFDTAIKDELNGGTQEKPIHYLIRGHYASQLRKYLEFFRRDQIMVISYSCFKANPFQVVNGVLRFVDLEPFSNEDDFVIGSDNKRKYVSKMEAETRQLLERYYEPHTHELKEILGSDFTY